MIGLEFGIMCVCVCFFVVVFFPTPWLVQSKSKFSCKKLTEGDYMFLAGLLKQPLLWDVDFIMMDIEENQFNLFCVFANAQFCFKCQSMASLKELKKNAAVFNLALFNTKTPPLTGRSFVPAVRTVDREEVHLQQGANPVAKENQDQLAMGQKENPWGRQVLVYFSFYQWGFWVYHGIPFFDPHPVLHLGLMQQIYVSCWVILLTFFFDG